jgi:hypothetical protein
MSMMNNKIYNKKSLPPAGLKARLPARLQAVLLVLLLALFPVLSALPAQATTAMPAPASVRVVIDTWNRFSVSWSAVSGATGYLLQRRADADTVWQTLRVTESAVTSHYDIVQNGHVYTYRVQALRNGTTGAPADSGEAAMLWPVDVSALPVSADKLEVSWTLPTNPYLPGNGYVPVIERRTVNSAGASEWTHAGARKPAPPPSRQRAHRRNAVRVPCALRYGAHRRLPVVSNLLRRLGWTKFPAPTGFSVTLASHGGAVLAWTPAVFPQDGGTTYGMLYTQIERSTDGGPFTLLGTLDAAVATYADGSISNGHVYRYRVRHIRSGATGDWSAEGRLVFVRPNTLTAEDVYPDQINLSWTWPEVEATVLGEARPRLERRKSGGTLWTQVALLEPGTTEYRDQGLVPDTIYSYRIQAQYPDGTVSPWYPSQASGREVRTGIAFSVGFFGHALSPTMVRLEWDFEALGGKTVRLERYNALNEPVTLLTTASETSYIDTDLLPGTTYRWRLVILAPSGYSTAASDPLAVKTETAPTPVNVRAAPATADRVVISWDYAYGLESGFEIWRKTTGTWTLVGETLRNVQQWTDTALPETGTAQWKVRAIRERMSTPPLAKPMCAGWMSRAATAFRRLPEPCPAHAVLAGSAARLRFRRGLYRGDTHGHQPDLGGCVCCPRRQHAI